MSRPPNTTILLSNLPKDVNHWLMGIDTQFFNLNQVLKGIKTIPSGIHFLHYSIPSGSPSPEGDSNDIISLSLRYGFWFECRDEDVFVMKWDDSHESMALLKLLSDKEEEQLNNTKYINEIGDKYNMMIEYPESRSNWKNNLISNVDYEIIEEFLPNNNQMGILGIINTMMPSREENMILLDVLKEKKNQAFEDQTNKEFKYTIIQFKKNSNTHDVEQTTKDYLDKTWYFEELYGNDTEMFLGELQLSFLNFILLGNFSSGLQWCNLLKLVLMCQNFMVLHHNFTNNFITVLLKQCQILPPTYLIGENGIPDTSIIDFKSYIAIMENLSSNIFTNELWNNKGCCGKMKLSGMILQKWTDIKITHKTQFGIDLNQLKSPPMKDGYEVYDIENHDDNDEDAPAIVY